MAKRPIPQIEADITANVMLQLMEYVKDYMAEVWNQEVGNVNTSLDNIKQKLQGTNIVAAQLGTHLPPSPTHPISPREGAWYFNTTDKKFYMFTLGSWQVLADLSHIVDTEPVTIKSTTLVADAEVKAKLVELKEARNKKDVRLITIELKANHDVSTTGAAIRHGTTAILDSNGRGLITESNGWSYPYQIDWNEVGASGAILFSNNPAGAGYEKRATINSNNFTWTFNEFTGNIIDTSSHVQLGTLEEVYEIKNGKTVTDSKQRALNLESLANVIKDQEEVDKRFLTDLKNDVIYRDATHIDYKDPLTGLITIEADITTAGNTIIYNSLIKPYDRIKQEQAKFLAAFQENGMSVEYKFLSKNLGVKFVGDKLLTYQWEHITKIEGGKKVSYIRFDGTASMAISNDVANPVPTWSFKAMPYDMKLSTLMDATNRTAIVQMNLSGAPADGDKLLIIDYLTTPDYIQARTQELIKDINDEFKNYEPKLFDYSDTERTLTLNITGGKRFQIISMPADAVNTPIGNNNKIKIADPKPADPTDLPHDDDQVTYGTDLVWIVKKNGDIMTWGEIKADVAAHKAMIINHLSNGNWELVRWESVADASVSLKKTLTVYFADGTSEDFKVG